MRLNGLGAPDEVTLVPLNKKEPAQPKTEKNTSRKWYPEHQKGILLLLQ